MKQRIIFAIVTSCLALVVLCLRYGSPLVATHELGDPADSGLVDGFLPAELDHGVLVRRSAGIGYLAVPLPDGRGARTVALRLRTEHAGSLAVGIGGQGLHVRSFAEYRTYQLLAPPASGATLVLSLAAGAGNDVLVDELRVMGRPGPPPIIDFLALLLIATVPALLMLLTVRLPFDWSLLTSLILLLVLLGLPQADRRPLLTFGPVAALAVGGLALSIRLRARPTFALLLLIGAGLRCYALGWGTGHAFHSEEQALLGGAGSGVLDLLIRATALLASRISGEPGWSAGWGLVLVGRAWSVAAGTALIVVVYALGQALLRPRWALLATAFVAFMPALVQQSHSMARVQWIVLAVALLVLLSVRMLDDQAAPTLVGVWLIAAGLLHASPSAGVWLAAPVTAQMLARRRNPAFVVRSAALLTLVVVGGFRWTSAALAVAADAPVGNPVASSGQLPYLYPLFGIFLWALGPLLMQLGVVGWATSLGLACYIRSERRWLPLLLALGLAFVVAGRGPRYRLEELLPLLPLLGLPAAFLLQTFGQRLRFRLGQRTVRLMGGTALGLALATTLALLNVYREPDSRVAASRWLLARLAPTDTLLLDSNLGVPLPLGVPKLYPTVVLPLSTATADDRDTLAQDLSDGTYLVTMLAADELALVELEPGAACVYAALIDGRLGFAKRISFVPVPHIGGWAIDDRRADPLIRSYDRPQLHVYERTKAPPSEVLKQLTTCLDQTRR